MVKTAVRQPKQARSAATLLRIVEATRSLLDAMPFADLTVVQIMERAEMSVGSFYTRFENKAALLPYLYSYYDQKLSVTTRASLKPEAWSDLSLSERLLRLVDLTVNAYRANRGLWRAILVHACSDPSIVTDSHRKKRREMVKSINALLLERKCEMRHPNPSQGVDFVSTLLFATCKDQILLADRSHGTVKISDRRLKKELTRALHGYLGVPDATESN
ncbi:MAG: TetR/AcrR family transcriptional regulator [bacterium]|nr:TetR/AcrR family transcriptional regulator [bacterium]